MISADRIEKEVISYIANLVENPDIVKHVLEMKQSKLKNDTKSTQRELNNLNAELLAAKNAKERYIKLFESGKDQISDINFIINKINEFDFKISEMETKIIHLQIDIDTSLSTILSPEQIVTALKTFIQLVDVSDENDKKILFQSLIKNIYITSDKHIQNIEFTFNLDSALLV